MGAVMRKTKLLAVGLMLLIVGCGYNEATFGPSLVPRLDAAKAISNSAQRDDAIRIVAMEATQMGDAGVVNDAVESLHDVRIRDEVAAYAARTFRRMPARATRLRSPERSKTLACGTAFWAKSQREKTKSVCH